MVKIVSISILVMGDLLSMFCFLTLYLEFFHPFRQFYFTYSVSYSAINDFSLVAKFSQGFLGSVN